MTFGKPTTIAIGHTPRLIGKIGGNLIHLPALTEKPHLNFLSHRDADWILCIFKTGKIPDMEDWWPRKWFYHCVFVCVLNAFRVHWCDGRIAACQHF